jgi:hypothetical protein
MFADVAKKTTSFLSATITLGIAPLLFVQVLYGQFFYTSSIIMAWPWFLVLVFVTIAYYGFYYAAFHGTQQPAKASRVMLLSVILITLVGFIYSNNFTLSQTPSRWGYKYFADPTGWTLNMTEPTLIPRFLHFFISAIAVGGLLLVFMALGNWKHDRKYARSLLQFGGKAFMYSTMAQFVVGFWFLISLPLPLRLLFMGENRLASVLMAVGMAGGFIAILVASGAIHKENIRLAAWFVPAITAVVILTMCIIRGILRDAYLSPYFHPEKFAVNTQWSVFALFLVIFLGGGTLWLVMLRRYGLLGQ